MFFKKQRCFDLFLARLSDLEERMNGYLSSKNGRSNPVFLEFFDELYSEDLAKCFDEFNILPQNIQKEEARQIIIKILHTETGYGFKVYQYLFLNTRVDIVNFGELSKNDAAELASGNDHSP